MQNTCARHGSSRLLASDRHFGATENDPMLECVSAGGGAFLKENGAPPRGRRCAWLLGRDFSTSNSNATNKQKSGSLISVGSLYIFSGEGGSSQERK